MWVRGETIGYGAFSTVSLATQENKFPCEIPSLMAVKSADSFGVASLENEKLVLDRLGVCPEIVRCFGEDRTVENGEQIYNLFLEYASRGSLATHIKKSGGNGLPESAVRRHTRSVLRGLRHIHSNGFAHCDIKLGNILLFSDGAVKIADFGLARRTEEINGGLTALEGVQIRGTPLYMAPESVNGDEYGSPADVWALGCAVVEMVSGKTAWSLTDSSNFMSLLIRIGSIDELPRIPEEFSEEGKDFLLKCFVKDRRKRWTAEMLLTHPFIAVDRDDRDHEEETCSVPLTKDEVSSSPRCPFDFPDWVSISSDWQVQHSTDERMRRLTTDRVADWSVMDDWFTVR